MTDEKRPVLLALAISGKKLAKMGLWKFFDVCAERGGVKLLVPSPEGVRTLHHAKETEFGGKENELVFPLAPAFAGLIVQADVVLSKVTNALVSRDEALINDVRNFCSNIERHPSCTHLDELAGQEATLDRDAIGQHLFAMEAGLNRGLAGAFRIHNPRHKTFERAAGPEEMFDTDGLDFPVVCKTRQAGGDASAHKMGIAFNEAGLHDFDVPFIAQEFANHDNAIYKVFVIGSFVHTVRRPSLPNLPLGMSKTILFDSQFPLEPQLKAHFAQTERVAGADPVDPPEDFVHEVARALGQEFGLSLFGFDIIRNSRTGNYGIIDLNYFPGYIGVPDFEQRLYDHVLAAGRAARRNKSSSE